MEKRQVNPPANPEDFTDFKIGTKVQAFWTNVKTQCENNILNMEQSILIDKSTLQLAEEKIKEEEAK